MGMPNDGVRVVTNRLWTQYNRKQRERIFVSIGSTSIAETISTYYLLPDDVATVELNISCPNATGLDEYFSPAVLRRVIRDCVSDVYGPPIIVKLPRDASMLPLAEVAIEEGAKGIIVSNSLETPNGAQSGMALQSSTFRMVEEAVSHFGDDVDIIACGGISTPEHVKMMLDAGAKAVQIYTAFVLGGVKLLKDMNKLHSQGTCRNTPRPS